MKSKAELTGRDRYEDQQQQSPHSWWEDTWVWTLAVSSGNGMEEANAMAATQAERTWLCRMCEKFKIVKSD